MAVSFNDASGFIRESVVQSIERQGECISQILSEFEEEAGVGPMSEWDDVTKVLFNEAVREARRVFLTDYDDQAFVL